eukprot:m.258464 g.258464  ORF g.258464 m.258464 type:complete len:896 (-) comp21568_c0_seq1:254-2941(-)
MSESSISARTPRSASSSRAASARISSSGMSPSMRVSEFMGADEASTSLPSKWASTAPSSTAACASVGSDPPESQSALSSSACMPSCASDSISGRCSTLGSAGVMLVAGSMSASTASDASSSATCSSACSLPSSGGACERSSAIRASKASAATSGPGAAASSTPPSVSRMASSSSGSRASRTDATHGASSGSRPRARRRVATARLIQALNGLLESVAGPANRLCGRYKAVCVGPANMSEEEFLRNQVFKLSEMLGRYQQVDAGILEASGNVEGLPWLLNREYVTPLMVEYERIIQQQRQELDQLRLNMEQLEQRATAIANENTMLHHRAGLAQPQTRPVDHDAAAKLKEQIRLLTRENDILIAQNGSLESEIGTLRQDLGIKLRENAMLAAECSQRTEALARSQQAAHVLPHRLEHTDQGHAFVAAGDSQMSPRADERVARYEMEISALRTAESERKASFTTLENQLADALAAARAADAAAESSQKLADSAKAERETIRQRLTMLEDKAAATTERQLRLHDQVRESVEALEQARLERDQALEKISHLEKVIETLRADLAAQTDEAKRELASKIDEAQRIWERRVNGVLADVADRDALIATLTAELDRARREKREADNALAKIRAGPADEVLQLRFLSEQLRVEAAAAARRAGEAEAEAARANALAESRQQALASETSKHAALAGQLGTRLSALEAECTAARRDLLHARGEIVGLQADVRAATAARDSAQQELTYETGVLRHRLELQESAAAAQLQAAQLEHRKAATHLQDMLRQSTALSVEQHVPAPTSTVDLVRARSEAAALRATVDQLTAEIEDLQAFTDEQGAKIAQLQGRLQDTEAQRVAAIARADRLADEEDEHVRRAAALARERDDLELRCRRAERRTLDASRAQTSMRT